jgi:uncharacterized protein
VSYNAGMPVLARILVYPIKSFDGVAVETANVLRSGALEYDRRFALVDAQGKFFNAKRSPRLHLPRSQFDLAAQTVTITVAGQSTTYHLLHDQRAIAAWASHFFQVPLRLEENAHGGFPDDTEAPGPTVVSTATLEQVARWFPELSVEEVRRRFRANLEIGGVDPFWEDRLYGQAGELVTFLIGEMCFAGTNPCQRCAVPPRDPETGDVYENFVSLFQRFRQESLPPWATRARFDHFYRLAVNTRLLTGGGGRVAVGCGVASEHRAES